MALSLFDQARAIVWAQWRTIFNHYPRANKWSSGLTIALTLVWYAGWAAGALALAAKLSTLSDLNTGRVYLAYGLLLGFFYWQVVPLMLATAGIGLEMKKLVVYPIPHSQLFLLDAILRVSTGIEVLILIGGASAGVMLNRRLPWWSVLGFVPFVVFNLALAAGVRELLTRIMARRFLREIVMFCLVLIGALPQFIVMAGDRVENLPTLKAMAAVIKSLDVLTGFLPWTATAQWAMGHLTVRVALLSLLWTIAAWIFGRWQFERGLRFDAAAAAAPAEQAAPPARWSEALFALPSRIFPDPLAAMIEKEYRSLVRAPRFRLVFFMGFSFGLLLWLPMLLNAKSSMGFFHDNYLTFVAAYALLLLGDVCLWNIFGFDRSAAQAYLVTPIKLRSAFLAKNLAALTFVLLEVSIVAVVCLLFRLPLSVSKILPAYLISTLMTFTLMSAGNLTSVYYPQPVNPQKSLRNRPSAKTQGLLMVIFLVAAGMSGLAYLAEYAFENRLAFYGVLGVLAIVVAIGYRISLDSAVEAAISRREAFISALSQNEAVITA